MSLTNPFYVMNAPLYHIAVLITVHNRCQQTLSCLRELFKQSLPDGYALEVFLTDDGCTDGTPQVVREHYPQVHIIPGDGSLYWNRGMWTAWNAASHHRDYDFYLWLNDDTRLESSCIELLLSASVQHENKAIIVGATVSNVDGKVTYGGRIENFVIPPLDGRLTRIDYFNGNIVLVPSYVFHEIGNLDPFFHHSKGDFDYGFSAKEKGIAMYQVGVSLGFCNQHSKLDEWCRPDVPFSRRYRVLHSPIGMSPIEQYYLESKHGKKILGIFHYFTIYFRCFFPWVWTITKKAKFG